MVLEIANSSDNTSYDRKSAFSFDTSDDVAIRSDLSKIDMSEGQHMLDFTGYYPRLIPGENSLSIKSDSSVKIIISTPVARWIT